MEADALAAWAGTEVAARPPTTGGVTGTGVVGGVWRRCSDQRPSWDDRSDLIYEQGRVLAEKRYWKARQKRRGVVAVQEVGWDATRGYSATKRRFVPGPQGIHGEDALFSMGSAPPGPRNQQQSSGTEGTASSRTGQTGAN